MSIEQPKGDSYSADTTLKDAIASISGSFISAKHFMDEMSAELAKVYQQDEFLSEKDLPNFSLADVTLTLKCAIKEVRDKQNVVVSIDAEILRKLPQEVLLQVTWKLVPQSVRTYQTEDEQTLFTIHES